MKKSDVANHSVAKKLLRELSSVSLSGHGVLRHLQAGSLMGCLTHLSLAGCTSVQDDPAWGHRPLLTSRFASLLLANPHLQYVDVSRTKLSNNGIFFFLLELSLCDPLLTPSGLKNLKQVVVGPPASSIEHARHTEGNGDIYVTSVAEALAELYFQSPALQMVALALPTRTQSVATYNDNQSNLIVRDAWCQLDEDNAADLTPLSMTAPQPCLVLRTRRGQGVPLENHKQMVEFSNARMADDWLTFDKASMNSTLDNDRIAGHAASHVVRGGGKESAPSRQVVERSVRVDRTQSSWTPQQEQFQSQTIDESSKRKSQGRCDHRLPAGRSGCNPSRDKQQRIRNSPADTQGCTNCHQQLHSRQHERVHSKAVQKTAASAPHAKRRCNAASGRQLDIEARRHEPLTRSLQLSKVHRARVVHPKRRSKLKLLRSSHVQQQGGSRTVDALLDTFAYDVRRQRQCNEGRLTGARSFGQGQKNNQQHTDVVDLSSPDRSGLLSPVQEQCHSDPGALMHQHQACAASDHDVWDLHDQTHSDGGTGTVQGANRKTDAGSACATEFANTGSVHDAVGATIPRRRRPRRRLLSLWDSPSPGKVDTQRIAAPAAPARHQSLVIDTCTEDQAPNPISCAALSLEIDDADRSASATQHTGTSTSTASDPANSMLSSPNPVPAQASDLSIVNPDGHRSRGSQHEQPSHVHNSGLINVTNVPASGEGSQHNSPDAPRQPRLTGAQRRRLRRQQELELMQITDPQGWTRLQQTMQALMPYGWDKRKEQHPIGAALDPTTFDEDQGAFMQGNPVGLPLDHGMTRTEEGSRSQRLHDSLSPDRLALGVPLRNDLDSDDDFDPVFTRAPPPMPRTEGPFSSPGPRMGQSSQVPTLAPLMEAPPIMPETVGGSNDRGATHDSLSVAEMDLDDNPDTKRAEPDVSRAHASPQMCVPDISQPDAAALPAAPNSQPRQTPLPAQERPTSPTEPVLMGSTLQSVNSSVIPALTQPCASMGLAGGQPVADADRNRTAAEVPGHHLLPNKITTGQTCEDSAAVQQVEGISGHTSTAQEHTELKKEEYTCSLVPERPLSGGVVPGSGSIEDGAGALHHRKQPQPKPPTVMRATSFSHLDYASLTNKQGSAQMLLQYSGQKMASAHIRPFAQAVDRRQQADARLSSAANDESTPEELLQTRMGVSASAAHTEELNIAKLCLASHSVRQKKTRAQREMERLSVFSWDKRKEDHPVGMSACTAVFVPGRTASLLRGNAGKELSFFHQNTRRNHSRAQQRCSSAAQHVRMPGYPDAPCPESSAMPVPVLSSVGSVQKCSPASHQTAVCTPVPGTATVQEAGAANSTSAPDSEAGAPHHDGTLSAKATHHSSHSDDIAQIAAAVIVGASSAQGVPKKKSRLSRLPRPLHRVKPA